MSDKPRKSYGVKIVRPGGQLKLKPKAAPKAAPVSKYALHAGYAIYNWDLEETREKILQQVGEFLKIPTRKDPDRSLRLVHAAPYTAISYFQSFIGRTARQTDPKVWYDQAVKRGIVRAHAVKLHVSESTKYAVLECVIEGIGKRDLFILSTSGGASPLHIKQVVSAGLSSIVIHPVDFYIQLTPYVCEASYRRDSHAQTQTTTYFRDLQDTHTQRDTSEDTQITEQKTESS